MRRINEAYEQNDFDTLKTIENQHGIETIEDTTVTMLEQRIEEMQDSIIFHEIEYQNLKESEWYVWRKKSIAAKRKNKDIFKTLEEDLLEDIARKIHIVHAYRKEFDKKGFY
jgi:phage pi2 protein 07